ncbi:MAG: Na+/H+ antiporter subunit E [Pseudomonadota bacterium]
MSYLLALAAGLTALWLLLSGYFDNTLLLSFGAGSILFTLYLAHRMGLIDREGVPIQLFPGILWYWAWLFLQIGKANFAVARAVLSPDVAINPKVFRVEATQKTDVGKATFANSITLTPGTVSVDLHDGEVLVHALTEDLADVDGIAEMGARVCAIEGPA